MRELPAKFLRAVSDVTIGTAIVIVHVVLADRDRVRRVATRTWQGTDARERARSAV